MNKIPFPSFPFPPNSPPCELCTRKFNSDPHSHTHTHTRRRHPQGSSISLTRISLETQPTEQITPPPPPKKKINRHGPAWFFLFCATEGVSPKNEVNHSQRLKFYLHTDMYTHTHTRTRTQTDGQTDGQGELGTTLGPCPFFSPPPTHILGLSSLSLFKVRIPFGPSYCPPSLLPFPPLQGNSLSLSTVYSLLSLVVLHRAVPGSCLQKGGRKRKKKCVCVYALPTFSHTVSSLPSKGDVLVLGKGMAWPRWHWHVHASSFQFNFFIFFLYFSARSLFVAGGCLASWFGKFVMEVLCTHVLM